MLIIYNLSGLLIGILGLVAGFLAIGATGFPGAGVIAAALIWIIFGVWWRRRPLEGGRIRAYPALFFIPLPILAVPVAMFGIFMFGVELKQGPKNSDLRAVQLESDEKKMRSGPATGNVELSQKLWNDLQGAGVYNGRAAGFRIFTSVRGDAVLVLIQSDDLKEFPDVARSNLLDQVAKLVSAYPEGSGRRVFIGVKGRLSFGAIRVPPGNNSSASVLDKSPLYAFYPTPEAPNAQANVP